MAVQILKAPVLRALSLSPTPRLRAIRLAPPMPKRLATPVMKMNIGRQSEAAATWLRSPICPMKNVSAML